jgi:hypothetical protein
MQRLFFFFYLTFLSASSLFSQESGCNNFYYLYSGNLVCANSIEYKTPVFGTRHFIIDGKRVELDKIKFYKNETGFYGNTAQDLHFDSPSFVIRIKEGNLNLYEYTGTVTHMNMGPHGGMVGSTHSRVKNYYYNKGYGNLKKAKYSNLKVDLADNPESLIHINKYKKLQTAEGVLIGTAAVILVGSVIHQSGRYDAAKKEGKEYEMNPTGIVIGAGFLIGSGIISFSKPKHLKTAIDFYNK